MVRSVALLALCAVLLTAGCDERRSTSTAPPESARPTVAADMRLRPAPKWMGRYCHKAADDLGYTVICPRRLPPLLDVVPCKGPAPREELWGQSCRDYVLDMLFTGPRGFRGPFRTAPRAGHLAIWTIPPTSAFDRGGLFGCPGGGQQREPDRLGGHSGSWWECPATGGGANLNTGHVAFQWLVAGRIYRLSVHGISEVNRQVIRRLFDHVELVGPRG